MMRRTLIELAALLLIVLAAWTFWPRAEAPVGVSAPLPPAKEVRKTEKVAEPVKQVRAYPKAAKAKLNLPPAVVKDDAAKLTTTAKLDAEERPYTLSTVIDAETGESAIYARPDPLPWLAPGKRGAVGISYGMKNGEPAARLYANHEFLRVKALRAGATGTLDQGGDRYAGVFLEFGF